MISLFKDKGGGGGARRILTLLGHIQPARGILRAFFFWEDLGPADRETSAEKRDGIYSPIVVFVYAGPSVNTSRMKGCSRNLLGWIVRRCKKQEILWRRITFFGKKCAQMSAPNTILRFESVLGGDNYGDIIEDTQSCSMKR